MDSRLSSNCYNPPMGISDSDLPRAPANAADPTVPTSSAEPLPVLPILNYDDGQDRMSLVYSEPAPGELMITEPVPPASRNASAYAGIFLGLAASISAVASMFNEDWIAKTVVICIGLGIAYISGKVIKAGRLPHFVHITSTGVVLYGQGFWGCSQLACRRDQIKAVWSVELFAGLKPKGQLNIKTRWSTRSLFIKMPIEEVTNAAKIICAHLGMPEYGRLWYEKPIA